MPSSLREGVTSVHGINLTHLGPDGEVIGNLLINEGNQPRARAFRMSSKGVEDLGFNYIEDGSSSGARLRFEYASQTSFLDIDNQSIALNGMVAPWAPVTAMSSGQLLAATDYANAAYIFSILGGDVTVIPRPDGYLNIQPTAINDSGAVVGMLSLSFTDPRGVRGFFSKHGTLSVVASDRNESVALVELNAKDQAVGWTYGDTLPAAILFDANENKGIRRLLPLSGKQSRAHSINDRGIVVGDEGSPTTKAFIYDIATDSLRYLQSMISSPVEGMEIFSAQVVDNGGVIAAIGSLGEDSAIFVLSPTPQVAQGVRRSGAKRKSSRSKNHRHVSNRRHAVEAAR